MKLVMVSIGKPGVGMDLCNHLGIKNGETFIFADPENVAYDALDLNKGVGVTFFNPATPFAIKDRLFRKEGMSELNEVLGKWSGAFYIPPKTEQAFNQGGTFVFNGPRTEYAHYDEATGAHADIDYVIDLAKNVISKK